MPKLGQDVFFTTPEGCGENSLKVRAAKVVQINDDESVNLCVFKGHLRVCATPAVADDGCRIVQSADEESATFFAENVKHCPEGSPGSWNEKLIKPPKAKKSP